MRAYCSNLTAVGTYEKAGKDFTAREGFDQEIADAVVDAATARDRAKEFALMSLYMQRTHRAAYNPQDDGFVFSLVKVKAYTDRFHRLNQAKRAEQEFKKKHHLLEIPRTAGKAA
jgi:hypothetical protein